MPITFHFTSPGKEEPAQPIQGNFGKESLGKAKNRIHLFENEVKDPLTNKYAIAGEIIAKKEKGPDDKEASNDIDQPPTLKWHERINNVLVKDPDGSDIYYKLNINSLKKRLGISDEEFKKNAYTPEMLGSLVKRKFNAAIAKEIESHSTSLFEIGSVTLVWADEKKRLNTFMKELKEAPSYMQDDVIDAMVEKISTSSKNEIEDFKILYTTAEEEKSEIFTKLKESIKNKINNNNTNKSVNPLYKGQEDISKFIEAFKDLKVDQKGGSAPAEETAFKKNVQPNTTEEEETEKIGAPQPEIVEKAVAEKSLAEKHADELFKGLKDDYDNYDKSFFISDSDFFSIFTEKLKNVPEYEQVEVFVNLLKILDRLSDTEENFQYKFADLYRTARKENPKIFSNLIKAADNLFDHEKPKSSFQNQLSTVRDDIYYQVVLEQEKEEAAKKSYKLSNITKSEAETDTPKPVDVEKPVATATETPTPAPEPTKTEKTGAKETPKFNQTLLTQSNPTPLVQKSVNTLISILKNSTSKENIVQSFINSQSNIDSNIRKEVIQRFVEKALQSEVNKVKLNNLITQLTLQENQKYELLLTELEEAIRATGINPKNL